MGDIKVKVVRESLNSWGLATNLVTAARRAEHAVAVQAQSDTADYVPALNHVLRDSTQVKDNLIIYPGPYARYLYYGKVMVYKDPPYLRRRADGKAVLTHYGQKKVAINKNLQLAHSPDPKATSFWFDASKKMNLDKWLRVAARAVTHYDSE